MHYIIIISKHDTEFSRSNMIFVGFMIYFELHTN